MKQGILNQRAAWRHGAPTDDESLVLVHIRRRDRASRLTETSDRSTFFDFTLRILFTQTTSDADGHHVNCPPHTGKIVVIT